MPQRQAEPRNERPLVPEALRMGSETAIVLAVTGPRLSSPSARLATLLDRL